MRALGLSILLSASAIGACGGPREAAGPGPVEPSPVATAAKPDPRGAPLEFALDPVERDFEHRPESEVLRGRRAVVLLLTTYDVGSLMALRTLAPTLNALPKDTECLLVAIQPLGDRPLVASFFDAEKTPCRRAIGDPKRGRLGDLAQVHVVPTVLVLRPDGTLARGFSGTFTAEEIEAELKKAK